MKIGIDAHSSERKGTGNCTYIRGLLKSLARIDKKNNFFLYVTDLDHPFYDSFKHLGNFQIRLLKQKNPFIRIPFSLAKKSFTDKLDILHVQYISPPFHKGRLIVTIHDLAFLHFPESFNKIERTRSKILIPRTAKKAKKVISGSFYSKNDLIRFYRINPAKIEVTYYGTPLNSKPIENIDERKKILAKYHIDGRFIFTLSRLNYRKNINGLIKAYKNLRNTKNVNLKLVIGGKKDFLFEDVLKEISNSGYEMDIILTGYIKEEDLPNLFYSAELFIYPSLFEGFGFPPLEAMACGCPVIASNVSSIPEIIGDAGMLIDPNDVNEISNAMFTIVSNNSLKEKLRKEGFKRTKFFNWDDTARKTLRIYENVYKSDKDAVKASNLWESEK